MTILSYILKRTVWGLQKFSTPCFLSSINISLVAGPLCYTYISHVNMHKKSVLRGLNARTAQDSNY
jgi:hypothetical protein